MGNSYAVVPNILPGNVTVGGNLTIAGDQLRIGAAAPFVRVGKDTFSKAVLSYNLGFDAATLDTGVDGAHEIFENVQGSSTGYRRFNPAGAFQNLQTSASLFTDYTAHNHTGTVTEDVIYSQVIRANVLNTACGIDVQVNIDVNVQGAGNTALRLKFGGGIIVATAFSGAQVGSWVWNVHMRNKGAANSQNTDWMLLGQGQPVQVSNNNATAVNTAVDQTLQIAVLNANAADSQNLVGCKFTLENSN